MSSGSRYPAIRSNDEQAPLLPRAHSQAPLVARCILCLSGWQLLFMLLACFFVHLILTGQLQAYSELLLIMLSADIACVLVVVISAAFTVLGAAGMSLEALKAQGCCLLSCYLCWLALSATLCWHSMVRICVIHKLEVECMFPKVCHHMPGRPHTPELSGFLEGFLLSWVWLPKGLFMAVLGAFWRPWHFLFYALPVTLAGQGDHLVGTPWWQWREIIIGTVFWSCAALVFVAARSRAFAGADEADRRFLLVVGTFFSLLFASFAFYLTTEPVVAFWLFLLRPFWVLGQALAKPSLPMLRVEEWVATVLVVWCLLRFLYITASATLEHLNAHLHMEETLRQALAHPFRAELEQGFGLIQTESGAASGGGFADALGRLRRSASLMVESSSNSLREKHEALISARHEVLLMQAGSTAVLPGMLRMSVRRECILEDTWAALFDRPVSELLAPRVVVRFEGEKGLDSGGLTRDWFDSVGRALVEKADDPKGSSLLTIAPDQTLIPRPVAVGSDFGDVSKEQQEKFRALLALGRFMALAVLQQHPLPLSFSLILCKHILSVPVGMRDVQQLDPEFYRCRVEQVLKEGGLAEMVAALGEPLTFVSAPTEWRPTPYDLKPGGASLAVTEASKTEYVQLLCEAHLCGGIRREIQCLLQGFWDVLPLDIMKFVEVSPRELSVLISGVANLDPEQWRRHSDSGSSQVHSWFWEVVSGLNSEQRCMLLHFATGSSRLPPGGFEDLKPRFTVSVSDSGSPSHLPHAHTCVNQIVLRRYVSKDQLREKLLQALSTEDFGFM